jgi:hypothetical protein
MRVRRIIYISKKDLSPNVEVSKLDCVREFVDSIVMLKAGYLY